MDLGSRVLLEICNVFKTQMFQISSLIKSRTFHYDETKSRLLLCDNETFLTRYWMIQAGSTSIELWDLDQRIDQLLDSCYRERSGKTDMYMNCHINGKMMRRSLDSIQQWDWSSTVLLITKHSNSILRKCIQTAHGPLLQNFSYYYEDETLSAECVK